MTNSTEIQAIENRLIKLESEVSNTRDNLKGEISNTRDSLGKEISSIREYIKSQMDWIRPAIYGMFGVIFVLVIGIAGLIYDIKQEIGDMKQELGGVIQELGGMKLEIGSMKLEIGGIKQELTVIQSTGKLSKELSGDKKFVLASEDRKTSLIDSVRLENPSYQEYFQIVIHSSKSEGKHDSTLPINAKDVPTDFDANDSEFLRDDAHAVPLPHSMAFNQFPSFAFRHF